MLKRIVNEVGGPWAVAVLALLTAGAVCSRCCGTEPPAVMLPRREPPANMLPARTVTRTVQPPYVVPARVVPASNFFRGPVYHGRHSCPQCGTVQYQIARFHGDGTHDHSCPRCGTTWWH